MSAPRTQPWKTNLPYKQSHMDNRIISNQDDPDAVFLSHPHREIDLLFAKLTADAIDAGAVTEAELSDKIRRGHIRTDILEQVENARRKSIGSAMETRHHALSNRLIMRRYAEDMLANAKDIAKAAYSQWRSR